MQGGIDVVLVVPDAHLSAHLAHAIAQHLRWCRRNGHTAPPELAALLDALTANGGPARPEIADDTTHVEPEAVNYATAAAMLGVSARTVRRMVADGRLGAVRIGARVLIPLAMVTGLINGTGSA